ncbi:tyrosine-type recombinase/integrase [Campylobacter sp. VBCF_06 NA8]|uniref:tyrosine-type recombinase/integrase n=1 Tax=Campylobacter sp. VBCF_06 NA8 TaxID=2983822 RepID=UPI0022E9BA4B|nr:site-specific integrase [Campylobacter sp. VBCF_06 NA8]MDA3046737.1 tyrosine-type recombinase/integrase [Campylobacter sp. VBCF_06 NA8]
MNYLSDSAVKALKPKKSRYYKSVGGNLLVAVYPSGKKVFFYEYKDKATLKTKRQKIGEYGVISLSEERAKTNEFKTYLATGTKKGEFNAVFADFMAQKMSSITPKYKARIDFYFRRYFSPKFGNLEIKEITRFMVLDAIKPYILGANHESVKKCIGVLNALFKYALTFGYVEHNIIADIDAKALMPKRHVKHRATLTDEAQVANLLKNICEYNGNLEVRICALIGILTALRSVNFKNAKWCEIDLTNKSWKIKAENMKNRKAFALTLSRQSAEILQIWQSIAPKSEFVFPSFRSLNMPLSENTLRAMLRNLGYSNDELTPHGFRAMFSTICNERRDLHGISPDIIEFCLAHSETDKVKDAYNHAKFEASKAKMWQWWADYLQGLYDYTEFLKKGV